MIISYEEERKLTKTILCSYGMLPEEADTVGKVVTHSDFTGVYSHGLSRIILYIRQLANGSMNPKPEIKLLRNSGATLRYDCDNGSGIVAVDTVFKDVVRKAREYGIGIATGMHSSNIGCGAYYGLRAAEEDVIGIVCCNTLPSMAPFGGADALIGTNPIIVGVPTDKERPIVLDMSTSGVAMGKIQAAKREGRPIPLGWANDVNGAPTTDPASAYTVLPIAGPKGYGLAVVVDVLSAILAGAAFGSDTGTVEPLTAENTGFCIVVIDPAKFMPIEEFKERADKYVRMLKHSRAAVGFDMVMLPGEPEQLNLERFMKSGIEVSEAIAAELCQLSEKSGLLHQGEGFSDLIEKVKRQA